MTIKGFIPLKEVITWPEAIFEAPEFIDELGLEDFNIEANEELLRLSGTLVWFQEISCGIPFIDGFSIAFMNEDTYTIVPFEADVLPHFKLTIPSLTLSFRFETDLLKPVEKVAGKWEVKTDAYGKVVPAEIKFGGVGFSIELDGNFEIIGNVAADLKPIQIGDSGVVVEITGITPFFSDKQTLPAGAPEGFKGIFIDDATIHLPKDISVALPSGIHLDDLYIGSGGFSGKIWGDWTPQLNSDSTAFTGNGAGDIFGIPIALKEIHLEFMQNTFVESKIAAAMILPFFDQPVLCEICLTNDGDFTVTMSADQKLHPAAEDLAERDDEDGLFIFTKENLLKLKLKSIEFEKKDDVFAMTLAGSIQPLIGAPELEWPGIEIKALTIDSRGTVNVDGGWIDIPKQLSIDLYGFKLELTKIGLGKEESGSKWIGLSGGINIIEGIPLRGGVEGLKLIWHPDNSFGFEIKGINVAFEVEDVLNFDGKVCFINEPKVKGFKGGIKMVLYPLDGMMIDVQFIAGRNKEIPPYNFFYIFIGLDLPIGIPLGNSGAAVYGGAGLFGCNMLMDKRDNEAWFEDDQGNDGFYKRSPEGITDVSKWKYVRDGMAFGAGLTIGTASDNGFSVSAKGLLVIMIPGPIIVIEGKATMLQERSALSGDDPPFTMLAVLDAVHGEFLLNIDANFKYPEGTGLLVDSTGSIDVYFNFYNPKSWHIYLGQKDPLSKRICADILGVVKANAYLMIDPDRLEMGASASLFYGWSIEIVKVGLIATLEGNIGMCYKPVQAWGSLSIEVGLVLKVWEFGFTFSILSRLGVTTPKPWSILLEIVVKLDIPFHTMEIPVVLEWKEHLLPPIPNPLAGIGIEHLKVTEKWELEMLNAESESRKSGSPVIPLDARPVLNFEKAVADEQGIGGGSSFGMPRPEICDEYSFKYKLKSIKLYKQSKNASSTWYKVADSNDPGSDSSSPSLEGKWQVISDGPKNVKLMLWANTTFDILREFEDNRTFPALIEYQQEDYPCQIGIHEEKIWLDFNSLREGSRYFPMLFHEHVIFFAYWPIIIQSEPNWTGTRMVLTLEEDPLPAKKMLGVEMETGNTGDIRSIESRKTKDENATISGRTFFEIESVLREGIHPKNSSVYTDEFRKSDIEIIRPAMEPVPVLEIVLPEKMAKLGIGFTAGSKGKIVVLRDSKNEIKTINFDFSETPDDQMSPVLAESTEKDIIALKVSGEFKIAKLCYVTKEESIQNEYNARVNQFKETETHSEHWHHQGATLEPNSFYKLEVETETFYEKKTTAFPMTFTSEDSRSFRNYAYFQTENPPGAYNKSTDLSSEDSEMSPTKDSEHYPKRGPLKDLKPYIERTIPPQVASNEKQRPVYRSYDIGIIFNEGKGNIENMYLMADLPLSIRLYDNNNEPALDTEGIPIVFLNQWGTNPKLDWTREEELNIRILKIKCGKTIFEISFPKNVCDLFISSKELTLKSQTLYKAKLFAGDDYCVYEFNFITSKYTCFLHHIQSFEDIVWDHYMLTDGTASFNVTDLNSELSNLPKEEHHTPDSYNPKEESKVFVKLMNDIFKLGVRQLPDNLEILLLNNKKKSYGLFLESPEPIDWKRVDMQIRYNKNKDPIHETISDIKIINAEFNARENGNYNDECVDILLQEKSDISGLKIKHKNLDEADLNNYYIFGEEKILPCGTVVRIHSRKEQEHENPSPEIQHRYLNRELNEWHFDQKGEVIQILDKDDNVLHTRSFINYDNTYKEFIIVRNLDQTMAFIFFPKGNDNYSKLQNGRYLIELKFRRKIDNLPILKRFGNETEEATTIEFNF